MVSHYNCEQELTYFFAFRTSKSVSSKSDVQYIITILSVVDCPINYRCVTITHSFESLKLSSVDHDQLNSSMQTLSLYFLPAKHILRAELLQYTMQFQKEEKRNKGKEKLTKPARSLMHLKPSSSRS